jgi:hypothetical protein
LKKSSKIREFGPDFAAKVNKKNGERRRKMKELSRWIDAVHTAGGIVTGLTLGGACTFCPSEGLLRALTAPADGEWATLSVDIESVCPRKGACPLWQQFLTVAEIDGQDDGALNEEIPVFEYLEDGTVRITGTRTVPATGTVYRFRV